MAYPQDLPNRPLVSRERLALAGFIAFVAITVATCGACGGFGQVTRTPTQQYGAAVVIRTTCSVAGIPVSAGMGSGVIVSNKHVLTALHVVDCEDGGEPSITVDPGDGAREMDVEITLPGKDIARIVLGKGETSFSAFMTPVKIGPTPKLGERVCMMTMYPRPSLKCGDVQPPMGDGVNWHVGYFVEFGNSGSAMYRDGVLVGLVSTAWFCQRGHTCVGGIAPLQGLDWLIP